MIHWYMHYNRLEPGTEADQQNKSKLDEIR